MRSDICRPHCVSAKKAAALSVFSRTALTFRVRAVIIELKHFIRRFSGSLPCTKAAHAKEKERTTMSVFTEDRAILRGLAQRWADIAALEVQKEHEKAWRALYGLAPVRPVITIDQICWNEFEKQEELVLRCTDPFARQLEGQLREVLYRWAHFPCDMVVKPYFPLGKVWSNDGFGVATVFQNEAGHDNAETHLFEDCIPDEAALEKLHTPKITYDKADNAARKARAEAFFGDILPVKLVGGLCWVALWDRIVFWRGAETVLWDLIDRPEFLHDLMKKLVDIEMGVIDQMEALSLFESNGAFCHCQETWCDELPKPGFDPEHVRAKDCWVSGAAQIFSEVSPAMHDEFEIQYMKPIFERFGLVNYGCCEPLHNKIDIIRQIRNVRAISVSPWADVNIAADAMGANYVMARKPNPAYVAFAQLNEESIIRQTRETLEACRRNGTPVIFSLKDITTVKNDPLRLDRWHDIVKREIERF